MRAYGEYSPVATLETNAGKDAFQKISNLWNPKPQLYSDKRAADVLPRERGNNAHACA